MPTVSTEIEEVISVLIVSANKEVEILQSKPEIARNHEEDHVVTDETKGETEDGSITSGNFEVIEQLQKKLQKSKRLRLAGVIPL